MSHDCIILGHLIGSRLLQVEFIWVGDHLSRTIIYSDMVAERAVVPSVYIVRFRMYSNYLHDTVLGRTIVHFQVRYFGVSSTM